MTRAIARGQITFSEQPLIQEKEEIRSAWYAINGTYEPDSVGETGSYYITKQLAAKYSVLAGVTVRSFNGIVRSFNGTVRTFSGLGTARLDTRHVALREFLRASGLFLPDDSFSDVFDWGQYSILLAAYYAAERDILTKVESIQDDNINERAKLSDIEYLIGALEDGNDQSILSGGLVLAHIIGVKDSNDNILAFMNGMPGANDEFVDATHGVLMLAAGIPIGSSVSDAKTNAKFKVFSDGAMYATLGVVGGFAIGATRLNAGQNTSYIGIDSGTSGVNHAFWCGNTDPTIAPFSVSRSGYMKSSSGIIGGFSISASSLESSESYNNDDKSLYLSSSLLSFSEEDTHNGTASYFARLGSNVIPSVAGFNTTMAVSAKASGGTYAIDGLAIGIHAEVSGFKENFAFYCPDGLFGGLRPNVRHITSGSSSSEKVLSRYDHTIMAWNSVDMTISLPADPRVGQEYMIYHLGAGAITVSGNGKKIYTMVAHLLEDSVRMTTEGVLWLVYSGNFQPTGATSPAWVLMGVWH